MPKASQRLPNGVCIVLLAFWVVGCSSGTPPPPPQPEITLTPDPTSMSVVDAENTILNTHLEEAALIRENVEIYYEGVVRPHAGTIGSSYGVAATGHGFRCIIQMGGTGRLIVYEGSEQSAATRKGVLDISPEMLVAETYGQRWAEVDIKPVTYCGKGQIVIFTANGNAQKLADALVALTTDRVDAWNRRTLTAFDTSVAAPYRAAHRKPTPSAESQRLLVAAQDAASKGRDDDAIEYLLQAEAATPWWPKPHFNIALLAADEGDYEGAVYEMTKYLMLVPNARDGRAARQQVKTWEEGSRSSVISQGSEKLDCDAGECGEPSSFLIGSAVPHANVHDTGHLPHLFNSLAAPLTQDP